jgi:hypothetical protein
LVVVFEVEENGEGFEEGYNFGGGKGIHVHIGGQAEAGEADLRGEAQAGEEIKDAAAAAEQGGTQGGVLGEGGELEVEEAAGLEDAEELAKIGFYHVAGGDVLEGDK